MYAPRSNSDSADKRMQQMQERRDRCERIAHRARAKGLDVTWERVNRHYDKFCRWEEGRLATGYLIKQTGIRRTNS